MTLDIALAVGVGIVAGGLTHELAHAWTARALGAEVHVDWWKLDVYFAWEDEPARWRLVCVHTSPYALAAVGGVLWYLILLPRGLTPLTAGVLVFLLLLCAGGRDDFSTEPYRDVEVSEA